MLFFSGSLDSSVVLVCVCVCFGGTVTVPTLAMDTVFRTQSLMECVAFFLHSCLQVNIVTLVNPVFRH